MSDMKIEIKIDMTEFIERWSDDSFEDCIKDEIKNEVMRAVKNSSEYKAIVERQQREMIAKLVS